MISVLHVATNRNIKSEGVVETSKQKSSQHEGLRTLQPFFGSVQFALTAIAFDDSLITV